VGLNEGSVHGQAVDDAVERAKMREIVKQPDGDMPETGEPAIGRQTAGVEADR
jgi:hypothetical protein